MTIDRELSEADTDVLEMLRNATTSVLETALGGAREVALLDLPTHMNVGDSLIWKGELEYLQRLGVDVRYASDIARFDAGLMERLHPEGPILLHGGGNYGDTWPEFQEFRLKVAELYPQRKIVQLPQSIYFEDREAAAATADALRAHPDYVLLVRDAESLKRGAGLLAGLDIRFCPDMAFGWVPKLAKRRSGRFASPGAPFVVVARQDREKAVSKLPEVVQAAVSPTYVQACDWGLTGLERYRRYMLRLPGRLTTMYALLKRSRLFYSLVLTRAYKGILDQNMSAGLGIIGPAKVVVTDRLHAHIMASMLGIPNFVLDNHYGKILAVYTASSGRLSSATYVDRADELPAMLSSVMDVHTSPGRCK